MAPEQSKFLKLIEENSPEDRTPAEKAKVYLTSILKNAGYAADYKTFSDEVTITFGDGDKAVFEVKKVIPAEGEEHHPVEDAEGTAADGNVDKMEGNMASLGAAMQAAETIVGGQDPMKRALAFSNPKKNVQKAVGDVYNKVAASLKKVAKSIDV